MLYAINPEEVSSNELSEFVLLVSEGIKDTLSQYARVYESPNMLTDEDKRKILELCDEMAKMPRARWVAPVTFNESPLIRILHLCFRNFYNILLFRIYFVVMRQSSVLWGEIKPEWAQGLEMQELWFRGRPRRCWKY